MELILQIETAKDLLSIRNVPVVGLLLTVIAILIWEIRETRKNMKDKETRINQIIDNHLNDLKEHSRDIFEVYKKYSELANEIKEIVRGGK